MSSPGLRSNDGVEADECRWPEKTQYPSEAVAENACTLHKMVKDGCNEIESYPCMDHFHIGHASKTAARHCKKEIPGGLADWPWWLVRKGKSHTYTQAERRRKKADSVEQYKRTAPAPEE